MDQTNWFCNIKDKNSKSTKDNCYCFLSLYSFLLPQYFVHLAKYYLYTQICFRGWGLFVFEHNTSQNTKIYTFLTTFLFLDNYLQLIGYFGGESWTKSIFDHCNLLWLGCIWKKNSFSAGFWIAIFGWFFFGKFWIYFIPVVLIFSPF